jgi:hypothetical protein
MISALALDLTADELSTLESDPAYQSDSYFGDAWLSLSKLAINGDLWKLRGKVGSSSKMGSALAGCDEYRSGKHCSACTPGWTLSESTCSKISCNDKNCATCSSGTVCTECKPGYSKQSDGSCQIQCEMGTFATEQGTCASCTPISGCSQLSCTGKENSVCMICENPALTGSKCDKCVPGYDQSSGADGKPVCTLNRSKACEIEIGTNTGSGNTQSHWYCCLKYNAEPYQSGVSKCSE